MTLVNWDNKFSVNVEEIDKQHKSWINLINYLHEAMRAGKGKEVLGDILDEVINYTEYHFSSEERLFDKYNYPDAARHKQLHAEFVDEFKKIRQDYSNGKAPMSIDIMQRLREWLNYHIMNVDKEYTAFFNEKGVN